MLEQRIQQQFFDAVDLKYQSAEALVKPVADASQAIVGALQLGARDVAAFAALAASGDAAAAKELRDRTARIDALLAALTDGSNHEGKAVPPASGVLRTPLSEFATRWEEFKRRTDAVSHGASSSQAQPAKDA